MERYLSLLISFFMVISLTDADPGSIGMHDGDETPWVIVSSYTTKCAGNDSKCIKESTKALIPIFADGIPELDIKPLDPFFFAKSDASSQALKLIVTDATVTGFKGCIAKKMQRDVAKSKLFVKIMCDLILDGNYEMKGRLLILPIEGKGKLHAGLKKIVLNAEVDLGDIVKDGKKYWDIKNWTHTYELKDKADVVFENLFNGNEILGRAARELVTSSSNEIVLEIGPPVVKTVLVKIFSTINDFFHKVPIEDLTLD